jgi:hypothetical protein
MAARARTAAPPTTVPTGSSSHRPGIASACGAASSSPADHVPPPSRSVWPFPLSLPPPCQTRSHAGKFDPSRMPSAVPGRPLVGLCGHPAPLCSADTEPGPPVVFAHSLAPCTPHHSRRGPGRNTCTTRTVPRTTGTFASEVPDTRSHPPRTGLDNCHCCVGYTGAAGVNPLEAPEGLDLYSRPSPALKLPPGSQTLYPFDHPSQFLACPCLSATRPDLRGYWRSLTDGVVFFPLLIIIASERVAFTRRHALFVVRRSYEVFIEHECWHCHLMVRHLIASTLGIYRGVAPHHERACGHQAHGAALAGR